MPAPKRTKWPRTLIVPMPSDFDHGQWVTTKNGKIVSEDMVELVDRAESGGFINPAERKQLKFACTTQCCLVGWAALAFDEEGCTPLELDNPATAKFLNKFIELAGRNPVDPKDFAEGERDRGFIETVGDRASDTFEGYGPHQGKNPLTNRKAHALWKKTAAHFGYDVDNLVDI